MWPKMYVTFSDRDIAMRSRKPLHHTFNHPTNRCPWISSSNLRCRSWDSMLLSVKTACRVIILPQYTHVTDDDRQTTDDVNIWTLQCSCNIRRMKCLKKHLSIVYVNASSLRARAVFDVPCRSVLKARMVDKCAGRGNTLPTTGATVEPQTSSRSVHEHDTTHSYCCPPPTTNRRRQLTFKQYVTVFDVGPVSHGILEWRHMHKVTKRVRLRVTWRFSKVGCMGKACAYLHYLSLRWIWWKIVKNSDQRVRIILTYRYFDSLTEARHFSSREVGSLNSETENRTPHEIPHCWQLRFRMYFTGYVKCNVCNVMTESDVDRVELFRLTLRFFDDVSTAS